MRDLSLFGAGTRQPSVYRVIGRVAHLAALFIYLHEVGLARGLGEVLGSKGRMRGRVSGEYAYAPTRNRWVHLTCRPQFYKDWGYGLSEGYFPHPTAYSDDIERRLTAASMDPDWGEDISAIPHPEWRWQTDERLAEAIIPLQRMVKRKKWKKEVFDAVTMLDKANEEVIYKWQDDHMYLVSGYLGLYFPRKIINPAWPPCDEGYRISWGEIVTKAVRTLGGAWCNWKFDWQLEIFKQLRKKYAE